MNTRRFVATLLLAVAALAPLGLAGLAIAWRRGRRTTHLYVLLAAQVASFVPLFVLARYRLVAVCCLLLFAAQSAMADQAAWQRSTNAGSAAYARGAYGEAAEQFESALAEAEGFGDASWRLAGTLYNLADSYRIRGRFAEAEPLFERAKAVYERAFGPDSRPHL